MWKKQMFTICKTHLIQEVRSFILTCSKQRVMVDELVKISFGGDIMCSKDQSLAVYRKYGKYNYQDYFEGLKPLFDDSDYVLANLETPISDIQDYTCSSISFNTRSSILKSIKDCGISFLSTANNHCLDRGVEGIEETIKNLNNYGIDHSGTFLFKNESERFFIKDIKGIKFAFICCTYGTNSEHKGGNSGMESCSGGRFMVNCT